MNKLILIAGGSTLVYAVLALLMGVLPGIELSNIPPGPGVKPLTALQAEGRAVYVANGCSYCHTQQVRPLQQDKMFGRPSAPGDFAYQTPELLGSERTGPDLTNIGERQPSDAWQYIHLYNPRAVVPQSIMPAFDWLFQVVDRAPPGVTPVALPKAYAPTHGVVVPTHDAQALIAYLMALKQPAFPGGARLITRGCRRRQSASALDRSRARSRQVTMQPRVRHCSPPPAPPAIRPPGRVCPERSRRSRATRRSTTPTRHTISTSCCTGCRAPTSAAPSTPAQCRRSAPHLAMPTSRASSITSAVPGATMARRSRPNKWLLNAPRAIEGNRSCMTI